MKNKYLNKNVIGSDETGVGDYFTPLIVAAVFVPFENIEKLKKIGIKDSKKIKDKQILILFNKIKTLIKSNCSVRILSQDKYNDLNKKYNTNELKMFLHINAIKGVEKRVSNIDLVIIDKFSNEKSLQKYEKTIIENEKIEKIIFPIEYLYKGESKHIAVATASIVARAYLIKKMQKQNKKWNLKFPLGCNKKVIIFAKNFIQKFGKINLSKIAKIKFKITEKL